MTAITKHYKIQLQKVQATLKLTYRGGKFYRIEKNKGRLSNDVIKHLGKIIPPTENDIEAFSKIFPEVTYEAIKKEKTEFSIFNDAWFAFYEKRTGVPPKFNGADANHLKQIISYLKEISGSQKEALEVWQMILYNWKHLDEFHQKNTDLKYINSSLNKIITNVKSISKNGSKGVSDDYLKGIINDLST